MGKGRGAVWRAARPPPLLALAGQPGQDNNQSSFRHILSLQATHFTEQFLVTIHGPALAHGMQSGDIMPDIASWPKQTNMEDAEVDDFVAPLLDFRNVLQFLCDTLPETQGTVQRDTMPRATGMTHLSTPPPLFTLHGSQLMEHALAQASQSLKALAVSTNLPRSPYRNLALLIVRLQEMISLPY